MIAPSRYLAAVRLAAKEFEELLTGDLMLVEAIPQEEIVSAGGIIIASTQRQVNSVKANLPHFVRVLAVGPGFYDPEDPAKITPLDTQPGAIIMIGENSVKWWSHLPVTGYKPYDMGITSESEIQIKFKDDEAFRRVFGAINKGLEAKVDTGGA